MKTFKHTLQVGAGLALLVSGWSWANESGHAKTAAESWKPATLRVALAEMPQGDIGRGKQLNEQLMCASCHGAAGIAPTGNWPQVAGQKADYTYKMLLDYQSGLRSEDNRSKLMLAAVEPMSQQDMADVAAYYASLPAPESVSGENQSVAADAQDAHASAEELVRKGDSKRLITACASCHGVRGQGGKKAAAALAGQNPKAFIRTMQLYKSGQRDNDVNQVMSQIARKLTDAEINLLATYYQTQ
ncbi:MAG: c-type cytochrome [Thiothrix sp.]